MGKANTIIECKNHFKDNGNEPSKDKFVSKWVEMINRLEKKYFNRADKSINARYNINDSTSQLTPIGLVHILLAYFPPFHNKIS